jgi:hypothetical protein
LFAPQYLAPVRLGCLKVLATGSTYREIARASAWHGPITAGSEGEILH